jgi:two-component sensor histidine kinase
MLLKYVDDLLDIAKMEVASTELDYSQFNISTLVKSTGNYFAPLAASNLIDFKIDTPDTLMVEGDSAKLNRVLLNLVSNAFKYVKSGGYIYCKLFKKEDKAVFEIQDSGKGVSDKDKKIIFEKYQRGKDNQNERTTGTGLGLAIAKEFIELHGGNIEVADAPEGGALFRFEIPVKADAEVSIKEIDSEVLMEDTVKVLEEVIVQKKGVSEVETGVAAEGAPKVLVVEDNFSLNNYIIRSLGNNYRIYQAFNGEDGLKKAKEIKPDLIVTDFMMPQLSGDKMIDEIRKVKELQNIPIILLTANKDEEFKLKILKKGAQDYLNKPFTPEELEARVNNLIQIKLSRDILEQEVESKSRSLSDLILQLIQKKEEIEISLSEKESLLKEVHHRVKNNIQIIISLLNLQYRYIKDEKLGIIFNDIRSRIRTMSLAHEMLGKPEDINRIKSRQYVLEIIANVKRLMENEEEIKVKTEIDDIELDMDSALNMGLIINELLLDSFKTIHQQKRDGEIRLYLTEESLNVFHLVIKDTGTGRELLDEDSLGVIMLESFVQQMEGEVKFSENEMRVVAVRFKVI